MALFAQEKANHAQQPFSSIYFKLSIFCHKQQQRNSMLTRYKLPYICDTFKSPYWAMKGSQTRQDLHSRRRTHLDFLTAVKDQSVE